MHNIVKKYHKFHIFSQGAFFGEAFSVTSGTVPTFKGKGERGRFIRGDALLAPRGGGRLIRGRAHRGRLFPKRVYLWGPGGIVCATERKLDSVACNFPV